MTDGVVLSRSAVSFWLYPMNNRYMVNTSSPDLQAFSIRSIIFLGSAHYVLALPGVVSLLDVFQSVIYCLS